MIKKDFEKTTHIGEHLYQQQTCINVYYAVISDLVIPDMPKEGNSALFRTNFFFQC